MKTFTIDRIKLLEAIETLDLVPTRAGLLPSMYIRVEPRKENIIRMTLSSEVTGTFSVMGKGSWPFKKDFFIDRRTFMPFVLAAKDSSGKTPFIFYNKEKRLLVKHGSRKAGFDNANEVVQGYGEPPKKEVLANLKLTGKLRGLIHCARECASGDPSTPSLSCVYVKPNSKGTYVMATNQKLVYSAKSKGQLHIKDAIPFPLFLVPFLSDERLESVMWERRFVALRFPKGIIWQSVNAKARKEFPINDIKTHTKDIDKHPTMFEVDAKKLGRVIARITGYLAAVRRQDWVLELAGKRGDRKIYLSSAVPQCTFREKIRLIAPCKHDFHISWPLDMIFPVFEYLSSKDKGDITVRSQKTGVSYMSGSDVTVVIPRRQN